MNNACRLLMVIMLCCAMPLPGQWEVTVVRGSGAVCDSGSSSEPISSGDSVVVSSSSTSFAIVDAGVGSDAEILLRYSHSPLATGTSLPSMTRLDSGCFGQFTLVSATHPGGELRGKEDTVIVLETPEQVLLQDGLLGCSWPANVRPIIFTTPHLRIVLSEGIMVIRVYDLLTRVCLLRGKAHISDLQSRDGIYLVGGQERAGATAGLSRPYSMLDDLRYAWYWTHR